jgi:acetylornithine deacetylase
MKNPAGPPGFEWVETTTEGGAAHGSRPLEGRDAIVRMGRVLSRLERLDQTLQHRHPHPIQGTASLHASLISGGRELSTYPDACSLQVERRTITGEPDRASLAEVDAILADLKQEDPEFSATARFMFGRSPYETPAGHPLPKFIGKSLSRQGRTPESGGVTFWTDAAVLGNAGIPSVVFGPGGAGLHSIREYVLEADVLTCRDALVDLAHDFCSGT